MTRFYPTDLAALDAVEDAIEAYGTARYSPSSAVLARIRANVMVEASAAAATIAAERRLLGDTDALPAAQPVWTIGRLRLPVFQVPRRAFALGLAAVMTFGTSAAVFAAPPGSPFYNARVAIESAFLPNELDARLAAHETLIEQRLFEAQLAAARGDAVGLQAALAAYQSEVDAALGDVGDDAGLLAVLEAALAKHLAVLTALEAKVPDQAAIDHAVQQSQKAIVRIKEKGDRGGGPGARPTAKPNANPGGPGGPPGGAPGGAPDGGQSSNRGN